MIVVIVCLLAGFCGLARRCSWLSARSTARTASERRTPMPELTDQPNTVNTNDLDPDRFYELVDGDPVAFVTRVLIAKAQGTAPTNEEEIAVAQCCTLLTLQQLVRAGLDFDEALNQFCDGESTRPYKATASIDHGEFEVTITFLDTDDDSACADLRLVDEHRAAHAERLDRAFGGQP